MGCALLKKNVYDFKIIFSISFSLIPSFRSSSFRQLFNFYIYDLVSLLFLLYFFIFLFSLLSWIFLNSSSILLYFYFQNSLLFFFWTILNKYILNLWHYQFGGLFFLSFFISSIAYFILFFPSPFISLYALPPPPTFLPLQPHTVVHVYEIFFFCFSFLLNPSTPYLQNCHLPSRSLSLFCLLVQFVH